MGGERNGVAEGTQRRALIGEPANKEKTWPKQPNALSGKLRRAAPPLRKIGIHIDFVREGHDSTKVITIKARGQPQGDSKTSPASSANGKNPSEINETNTINAGDPPTIPTATIVGNKPLKNNEAGDANDADDLLHTPSAAKVCAQWQRARQSDTAIDYAIASLLSERLSPAASPRQPRPP
ncbi:MAG: hypothetical protein WCB77_25860 [Pseudolabrys sp.]|jgi:hypothetical protein